MSTPLRNIRENSQDIGTLASDINDEYTTRPSLPDVNMSSLFSDAQVPNVRNSNISPPTGGTRTLTQNIQGSTNSYAWIEKRHGCIQLEVVKLNNGHFSAAPIRNGQTMERENTQSTRYPRTEEVSETEDSAADADMQSLLTVNWAQRTDARK